MWVKVPNSGNSFFLRRRSDSRRHGSPHQCPVQRRPAERQQPSLHKPGGEHCSRGERAFDEDVRERVAGVELPVPPGHQIHQSLPPEVKAMWESGQVRVEVRGFSPGSVVANLIIIFTPSQSQDNMNVYTAILQSLRNTTKYSMDPYSVVLRGTRFSVLQGQYSRLPSR